MISRPRTWGFMLVLSLAWALALGAGFTAVAQAASEDVAMFYDELSQYGQWADYQNYGPVWRPTQVPQDWRPYTDGRWTPTDNGYVFETQEPWGWATYHYGNWMPTEGYGWVWVPGSTWYPSTVDWRTTPENAPEADSYVGWAPIPPPNYEPPPAYAPPSYYQGSPITDLLTAPFWIFVKAASFLLGLGQPYAPAYSYIDSGYLVPPAYVPVFYPQTIIVQRYYTPAYYPPAYYGVRSLGYAAYNWGPPVGYVSRVTRINQARFNRIMYNNSVNLTRIHNVVAPRAVLNRYGYIRHIVPPALAQGRRLPVSRPVKDFRRAQANLYKPNILPPPRQVPAIRGQIPRIQPAALAPGHGLPGTALPARATMRLTPQMTRQIEQLPPGQRLVPARAQPFKPAAATRPGPGQVQPQGSSRPGQFQPGVQPRPGGPPAGRVPAGEFHPVGHPGATPGGPRATTRPGAAPSAPSYRGPAPGARRPEPERQGLQRGPAPVQSQPRPRQLQQQERQREQQLRQQQERQQPQRQLQQQQQRQLQQRQRQVQQQQERQRQFQPQPRQVQQRQERQRQFQQQQRQQQQRQQQMQQQRPRQQQIQRERQRQPEQRRQPPSEKSRRPEERP
jgi:hypothetical protein